MGNQIWAFKTFQDLALQSESYIHTYTTILPHSAPELIDYLAFIIA